MPMLSSNLVNAVQRITNRVSQKTMHDYASLLSGQVGRLIFSMLYFVTLAKTLSLGEFGLFATASSIGIVLSRLCGLGFLSPLYRIATIRPTLIGVYTAGYITAVLVSLPVILAIAWALHSILYADKLPLAAFLMILAAEVVFWRSTEVLIVVKNGLYQYRTAAAISICGIASKAIGIVVFASLGLSHIEDWALWYCAINGAFAAVAVMLFYPRRRLRWAPKAWLGRSRDALNVSLAEALFYIQSELDKVLVLAVGGDVLAGLYAIIMRLIDLTAIPLRAANTMIVQWIMQNRKGGRSSNTKILVDGAIALMSVCALAAGATTLSFVPSLVGDNIASAVPFLWLALLVPAFRNCIEYHTELLYAHERTGSRVLLLIYLAATKAGLLFILLQSTHDFVQVALWLNAVFALLYCVSAWVTYRMTLDRVDRNRGLLAVENQPAE
ncbi:MAG: lipopolysaccharide biosynthesis protein [Pseudomonadota bacterium]